MKRAANFGFTLIEILVALAIIAIVVFAAIPTVSNIFSENLKSSSRKLMGVVKYLHHQALMKNKTVRLVVDFKENKYWAELASESVLLEKNDDTGGYVLEEDEDEEDEDEVKEKKFSELQLRLIKERSLSKGVKFISVFSSMRKILIKNGKAYVHFFPGGLAEASIIHLGQKEKIVSLVIEPMLGIAKFYEEYIEPEFYE